MYTRFRERRVRVGSRSDQHVRAVRPDRILRAVRQSGDQEDVRRVHRIVALAILHDGFQQLREPDVVAVGNHVRGRPISAPDQPDPALWYVKRDVRCLTSSLSPLSTM